MCACGKETCWRGKAAARRSQAAAHACHSLCQVLEGCSASGVGALAPRLLGICLACLQAGSVTVRLPKGYSAALKDVPGGGMVWKTLDTVILPDLALLTIR